MNIVAFTTFDSNFSNIQSIVEPNNKQYFEKYNVDYRGLVGDFDSLVNSTLISDTSKITGKARNYWTKIFLTYGLLTQYNYDWVFMLDADCLIRDHNLDIRTIIKMAAPNKQFLICHIDDPLTNYWNINIGTFFVKKTPDMISLFEKLMEIAFEENCEHYEQSVVQSLLRHNADFRKMTEIFPSHTFNHGGEFIFHACDSTSTGENFKQSILNKEQTLLSKLSEIKII
jgi:hypothetical protein